MIRATEAQKRIIKVLIDEGPISRGELAKKSETSLPTVTIFNRIFQAHGVIEVQFNSMDYRTQLLAIKPGALDQIEGFHEQFTEPDSL